MNQINCVARPAAVLALVACAGCQGSAGSATDESTDSTDSTGVMEPRGAEPGAGPVSANCGAPQVGPLAIQRLKQTEYANTIRDLFPTLKFIPYDLKSIADGQVVTDDVAQAYMAYGERVGALAATNLASVLNCDPAKLGQQACAYQFIDSLGRRAFRRPLTGAETQRLHHVFDTSFQADGFAPAIQLMVQAVLVSPHFLFRIEGFAGPQPIAAKPMPLTPHETASRLSYLLWGTMPDGPLMEAADKGQLSTEAQVAAQARRLMADPRAHDAVAAFHNDWLEIDGLDAVTKDHRVFPTGFMEQMRPFFKKETETFVDHVFWKPGGSPGDLLDSSSMALNKTLATFYGVPGFSGTDDTFKVTTVNTPARAGLLTQGTFLSTNALPDRASPVKRGKVVRTQLLCQRLPPPPADVDTTLPASNSTQVTLRQRLAQHRANPACSGCHNLMDPIGLGFEKYDAGGRYLASKGGVTVDGSGDLSGTDVDGPFDGAVELSRRLARSEMVQDCVVSQWFAWAFQRSPASEDACSMDYLKETFAASNHNMRDLVVHLTETDAFRYRVQESATGGSP